MKTYILGDIHGAYKALIQCLERSDFNKKEDLLITLGDIVDGWSQSVECIDELLTIKNRIDIKGNHDYWAEEYLKFGVTPSIWLSQGGSATLESYLKMLGTDCAKEKSEQHRKFFKDQHYYYIDDKNRLFVHGGFDWKIDFKNNQPHDMMWDRHAFQTACQWETFSRVHPTEEKTYFKEFREVFVGHTATNGRNGWRIEPTDKPLHVSNLWNLDQGAGWFGKLTIMNVDTKEYWQSDNVNDLYPDEKGRR